MSDEELKSEVVEYGRLKFVKFAGTFLPVHAFPTEYITRVHNMEVKEDDIFIVTYPKCGTTWTQYMIWEIINNPDELINLDEMMFKRFPFLEMVGLDCLKDMSPPRTMKLHVPFKLTPFHPQGKYLVMVRNPFDVCVSFFHFMKEMDFVIGTPKDFTFDEHFELFINGTVPFGDYFDFINGWFDQRDSPNVLFLHYEDCKSDHEGSVKRMAAFFGDKYLRRLEEDPKAIPKILERTSFDYMKRKLDFVLPTAHEDYNQAPAEDAQKKKVNMFRKGKVGDWRSCFSEDQKKRMFEKLQKVVRNEDFRRKLTPAELL